MAATRRKSRGSNQIRAGHWLENQIVQERLNSDTWHNQQAAAQSLMQLINNARSAEEISMQLSSESALLHWAELLFEKGWLRNNDAAVWIPSETTARTQVAFHG